MTVGQCAGVPSYKESNATTPINNTVSSAVPSATSVAPVVTPAAASATPSQQTQKLDNKNAALTLSASSSMLLCSAAFVFAFYAM